MTDSERIAALEKQVAQLQQWIGDLIDIQSQLNGSRRAYDAAIFALLDHQRSQELHSAVQRRLLPVSADVMPFAHPESHVEAFQAAEKDLLEASLPSLLT